MTSASEAEAAPPIGVALSVPPSWYEFDIHPAGRAAAIRRVVNARSRVNPTVAAHRDDIIRALKKAGREAWETGAVYCGCMAENFDAEPMVAGVTVSIVRAGTGAHSPSTDPTDIVRSLAVKPALTEDDTWLATELVELPGAGPAARVYGVEDVEYPGDETVRMALTQTIIPVPGGSHVAVVAGSSPVLDLVDGLHNLFDSITATFRFVPLADAPRTAVV